MSIADKKYKELILDIYNNGTWDSGKEVRAKYADGTPAYCKSVFGRQIIFEEDELPLVTCKKMFPITSLKEMYLIWIKQTNKIQDFKDINCHIWNEWELKDGTLGKSYSYQFESEVNNIITVNQRIVNLDYKPTNEVALSSFLSTNKFKTFPFYNIWKNIINRCHNIKKDNYKYYGQLGIFIHKDWLNFETFCEDLKKVPQYQLALRENFIGWELDKDYFKANCYSLNTCVWLRSNDNKKYMKTVRPIKIIFKDNSEKIFLTISEVKNYLGFPTTSIHRWLHGGSIPNKVKILSISYIEDGKIYRKALSKNQIKELLYNLVNNPTSRRLMTSFWNFKDVQEKALMECAWTTQWNIRGNSLDLMLIQRSADVGLGVPFNWFQYKALQILVSHCTGYKPGRFIHQMGCVHYYDRHEEDILKVLDLPEYDQPCLTLDTNKGINFFDYSWEDFKIQDYQHGPHIPFEIAI